MLPLTAAGRLWGVCLFRRIAGRRLLGVDLFKLICSTSASAAARSKATKCLFILSQRHLMRGVAMRLVARTAGSRLPNASVS